MNSIENVDEDVTDLGVASIETKGPPIPLHDSVGGRGSNTGISED